LWKLPTHKLDSGVAKVSDQPELLIPGIPVNFLVAA
jgi:hypothetical protein